LNNLERKKGKEENIEECDGSSNNEDGDGSSSWNKAWYPVFEPPNVSSSPTTMEMNFETRLER
jgi:hypothetical protein